MTPPGGNGDRDLRARLRDLRVDPPDAGFSSALHRKLLAESAPEPPGFWRRWWPLLSGEMRWLWPSLGAAAAAAVIFMFAIGHREDFAVAARLPASKVAVVRVNLNAEVAVQSAQIKVSLPEGLVFWADGQELPQRAFEWTQPLQKGDNDIPIAVRGLKPGRYQMTVHAQIGAEQVDDEVVLEVIGG